MNRDPDAILREAFSALRLQKRDTSRAEYGFESRLMARLRADKAGEERILIRWSLRLAALFGCMVLALGWFAFRDDSDSDTSAAAAAHHDELFLVEFVTGQQI